MSDLRKRLIVAIAEADANCPSGGDFYGAIADAAIVLCSNSDRDEPLSIDSELKLRADRDRYKNTYLALISFLQPETVAEFYRHNGTPFFRIISP